MLTRVQVHRESATGDSVQLNVVQDTSHFRLGLATAQPVGKIWGPWLWYLVSEITYPGSPKMA